MTEIEFKKLVNIAAASTNPPPLSIFSGGAEDWRSRCRLAQFLSLPSVPGHTEEAIELFKSIESASVDDEDSEEVEEKAAGLQRLAELLRDKKDYKTALHFINRAIELAEGTDFLYKFILRGELWADRWNLLTDIGQEEEAEAECDERIAAYEDITDIKNSYMYFGYRFKAQLAAKRGDAPLIVKDYMHMALKFMEIPDSYRAKLDEAFSATHGNMAFVLQDIDKCTPKSNFVTWDI
ncbi:MAG: tetratricopeptide repeat protein [Selenomonadaceae bacterium]|nr:tetratricopeptide repeat protein [Selenomonadaceae bacterium]